MSYVIVAPELVEAAAANLAGIQSALGQATAAAAGPTTGILAAGADEVSAAISRIFGTYGNEFQAFGAQAASFHDEFVSLLNGGASAYSRAEAIGAQSLVQGFGPVAETAANPLQAFVNTTTANLQALGSALSANPTPVLSQLLINQSAYGRAISTEITAAMEDLPAQFANLPAGIAALVPSNPGAILQGIVNNQVGYANLIGTSLQNAGSDLVTGLNEFPTYLQNAQRAFATGDFGGGLKWIGGGLLNPLFSGFSTVTGADGVITVTPLGAAGDLLPIFTIPGQMAQDFTNTLPPGTIGTQIAQNFTNAIDTLTNTEITATVLIVHDPNGPFGLGITIDAQLGLPLALAIDVLGGPFNGLNELGSSLQTSANAIQSGNVLGAAAAALNAPGAFVNGFLNGQTTLPLSLEVSLGGDPFSTTLNIPLNGILVPAAPYGAVIDASNLFGPGVNVYSTVTGTPIGGLIPGLLDILPRSIAAALGGVSPDFPPFSP